MSKTRVITPEFRASYPNLIEPGKKYQSEELEYRVTALFDKDTDLSPLKEAIDAACEKKWGPDQAKWPKNMRLPLRDQGEKAGDDGKLPMGYEEGAVFVNLKSKDKPGVVDQGKKRIDDASEVYAGVYLRADINAYAYDFAGNRGVSFGLNNIQKVKEGEPLGGKLRPEDAFEALAPTDDDFMDKD